MAELGIESYESRCKYLKLRLFYKIVGGQTILDLTEFLHPPNYMGRNDHSRKFAIEQLYCDYRKYSFFPSTVILWNGLDEATVTAANKEIFSDRVKDCLTKHVNKCIV